MEGVVKLLKASDSIVSMKTDKWTSENLLNTKQVATVWNAMLVICYEKGNRSQILILWTSEAHSELTTDIAAK
jgi:hypothetical protein